MFQLIDSFFFISLGITFVLLFLMAFHFKNRVSALENKNNALTEICNTIVHEINQVKQIVSVSTPSTSNYNHIPVNTMMYTQGYNEIPQYNDEGESNEDDGESNEDDGESSEDDGESSEDDGESSEDDENRKYTPITEEYPSHDEHILKLKIESIEYSDEDTEPCTNSELKSGESEETIEVHKITLPDDNVDILEETLEDFEVTKIDDVVHIEDDIASEIPSVSTNQRQSSYKKMNVQMLRTMAISKGLCSDPSKMKKQELLKMLDDHENEN